MKMRYGNWITITHEQHERELTVYRDSSGRWTAELWRGHNYVFPKSTYRSYNTAWAAIKANLYRLNLS